MSLIKSAKWNALSQFFKIFIQLVNMVYLATIIPPSEYGIMAMAAVVINLGVLLRDLGTAAAIIQRKSITDKLISSIFWLNIFIGVLLFFIVFSISPIISHLYNQEKLIPILMLLSVNFPVSSSSSAHLALLERDSKFKIISIIEIVSSLVSVILAVILANIGFGVFSLVFQALLMSIVSSVLFWKYSRWRPIKWHKSMYQELKSIFGFSMNLSLFNIINYFSRNADSFIIGKYMSASILGSYNLAYRIMLFPLASLTFVFGRSLYPIMSRHQDDKNYIASVYLNCIFYVLLFSAPLMSGIALLSKPLILTVFGQQWILTSSILIWLAPTAILQSVISTTGAVFNANGRTDILLYLGIYGSLVQVTGFLIGVHGDIQYFAKCYFLANIINFFPPVTMALNLLGLKIRDLFFKIYPIVISNVIMVFSLYYLIKLDLLGFDNIKSLIFYPVIGSLIYSVVLIIFSSNMREKFLLLLRGVK